MYEQPQVQETSSAFSFAYIFSIHAAIKNWVMPLLMAIQIYFTHAVFSATHTANLHVFLTNSLQNKADFV